MIDESPSNAAPPRSSTLPVQLTSKLGLVRAPPKSTRPALVVADEPIVSAQWFTLDRHCHGLGPVALRPMPKPIAVMSISSPQQPPPGSKTKLAHSAREMPKMSGISFGLPSMISTHQNLPAFQEKDSSPLLTLTFKLFATTFKLLATTFKLFATTLKLLATTFKLLATTLKLLATTIKLLEPCPESGWRVSRRVRSPSSGKARSCPKLPS